MRNIVVLPSVGEHGEVPVVGRSPVPDKKSEACVTFLFCPTNIYLSCELARLTSVYRIESTPKTPAAGGGESSALVTGVREVERKPSRSALTTHRTNLGIPHPSSPAAKKPHSYCTLLLLVSIALC